MADDIFVVGVGMTPFGRHLDKTLKTLTAWAIEDALKDGRIERREIGAAFFGNSMQGYMQGQHCIRGQVALLPTGIQGIPIVNVENACASGSTAFHLAVNTVRAGAADVALAIGAEKMFSPDKAKMFAAFDSGWDLETAQENADKLIQLGAGVQPPPGSVSPRPYSLFMEVYAAFCRFHMREYGLTQRQLAIIAAKNHGHSVHNVRAQYRNAMSVEDILGGAPITYPLTGPMCSPISDGAAAAIVCSESGLRRLGLDRARAIRVRASVLRSGTARQAGDLEHHITRLAADQAYAQAGLGPRDVHVAEVHDATAMGEVLQSENLGFCAVGGGGELAQAGTTTLGGRIPINLSGGLESKGHPIGATGVGQIFELVAQLRGECGPRQVEGARVAIQENGGGLWGYEEASAHVGIFSRD
jgi:acetyl-CoA acyltransferase